MAPAAVQTKQSVSASRISAPALFTQASMAGALTPSRSPITSTRLPRSFIVSSSELEGGLHPASETSPKDPVAPAKPALDLGESLLFVAQTTGPPAEMIRH